MNSGCIKLKPGGVSLPKLVVVQDLGFFQFRSVDQMTLFV